MNNEPVAWMEKDEFDDFINGHRSKLYGYIVYRYNPMEGVREDCRPDMEGAIPLYDHPAKTLADEEIDNYYKSTHLTYAQYEGFVEGVKWALGKANEKCPT